MPHVDNLRPISLVCCVGKVMERIILNRLQKHIDNTELTPMSMFGFRQSLCTQDIILQLKELVFKLATRNCPREIPALDLKEAFDNVTHDSILTALIATDCKVSMYQRSTPPSHSRSNDIRSKCH